MIHNVYWLVMPRSMWWKLQRDNFTANPLCTKSKQVINASKRSHLNWPPQCAYLTHCHMNKMTNVVQTTTDSNITMTSWWVGLRLKSPASRLFTQPFIQAEIKENIKAPRNWPLCEEFTGTGEFPAQMTSNAENVSIWWRHHACFFVN